MKEVSYTNLVSDLAVILKIDYYYYYNKIYNKKSNLIMLKVLYDQKLNVIILNL